MELSTGILLGIVAMAAWGTADFFVVKALKKQSIWKILLWSQLTGLAIFFLLLTFLKFPAIDSDILIMLTVAGLLYTLAYLGLYKSFEVGKLSIVSPVAACWVVVTVILGITFLNESVTFLQSIGIILAIAGAVLVSFKLSDLRKLKGNASIGVKFALVNVFAVGVGFVLFDILVEKLGWFVSIFLLKMFIVVFLAAFSTVAKKDISLPRNSLFFIAIIGLLEALAFASYGIGISSEYTVVVAPIAATFPLVTVLLALVFLKEKVELNQKFGIASVIAGVVLLAL